HHVHLGSSREIAEYISSRCVLFTYFQGSIGDVVDEHFSRALSQPSAFTGETKPARPWKAVSTSPCFFCYRWGFSRRSTLPVEHRLPTSGQLLPVLHPPGLPRGRSIPPG
uniref:Uncharacterized protein n=1 Tax=Denticeps clupeoides TaxID=299321 RepID=A0AAY4E182_9TELE